MSPAFAEDDKPPQNQGTPASSPHRLHTNKHEQRRVPPYLVAGLGLFHQVVAKDDVEGAGEGAGGDLVGVLLRGLVGEGMCVVRDGGLWVGGLGGGRVWEEAVVCMCIYTQISAPTYLHPHALPVDEAALLEVEVPRLPPRAAALARQVGALGRDGVGVLMIFFKVGGGVVG